MSGIVYNETIHTYVYTKNFTSLLILRLSLTVLIMIAAVVDDDGMTMIMIITTIMLAFVMENIVVC